MLELPPSKEHCCPVIRGGIDGLDQETYNDAIATAEGLDRTNCIGAIPGELFGVIRYACPTLVNRRRALQGQDPVSQEQFEAFAANADAAWEDGVKELISQTEQYMNNDDKGRE